MKGDIEHRKSLTGQRYLEQDTLVIKIIVKGKHMAIWVAHNC